ncbi:hypothetical protein GQ600_4559 [Phytophthora cactorum]|nr:hypothetical protein GQ600_20696 [Phytophthora cactorum]KAF1788177.1 hypothetical protein GQ600_4559 [Phytophthora cactorum]
MAVSWPLKQREVVQEEWRATLALHGTSRAPKRFTVLLVSQSHQEDEDKGEDKA